MDFDFSDEQQMLRDSVRKWVDKAYSFEHRKGNVKSGGFSREAWREIAALGLTGLTVPQAHGGMGLGAVDAMVVTEELGRGLVLEPYSHAALVATGLLSAGGSQDLKSEWLPKIASGDAIVVLAHQERAARYRLSHVTTTAKQEGASWIVGGEKSIVPVGDKADAFIVPARVAGVVDDPAGIALFLVKRNATGVTTRGYLTQDGARAAEVGFHNVRADLLSSAGSGFGILEEGIDIGIAAACAEGVGVMDKLVDATVIYMNTRRQFGVAIASFQALRHRIADVKMQLELGRSMSYFASLKLNSPPADRRRALAQAKLQLGDSMRFVGQQCIQLHGGIGVTDEYIASHCFKRLTLLEMSFGDTMHQLGEVSARMDERAGVIT